MGMVAQSHAPAALSPGNRPNTHCRGEPHGRSGRVRNISPPPGFDPQTFQTVAVAMSTTLSRMVISTKLIVFSTSKCKIAVSCDGKCIRFAVGNSVFGSAILGRLLIKGDLPENKIKVSFCLKLNSNASVLALSCCRGRNLTKRHI